MFHSSSFQVEKLVLIDASVYTEGTGNLANLPRTIAYAGVSLLLNKVLNAPILLVVVIFFRSILSRAICSIKCTLQVFFIA